MAGIIPFGFFLGWQVKTLLPELFPEIIVRIEEGPIDFFRN